MLIDSRTGFSDESGICTRDLADYLIVLSGLNRQNIEGTAAFFRALRAATGGERKVEVVLSPVPNGEDALIDERAEIAAGAYSAAWGSRLACDLQIPYHPQLALTEEPHIFRRRRGYLYEAYVALERRTLELLGDTPKALGTAAFAAFQTERFDAALALLERARLLEDGPPEAIDRFVRRVSENNFVSLTIDDSRSARLYDFLASHVSDEARSSFVSTALWLPHFFTRRRLLGRAEAMFRRVLHFAPESAEALGHYASFVWTKRGDLDAAEKLFRRAISADPQHAYARGHFAVLLLTRGRRARGLQLLREVLTLLDPDDLSGLEAICQMCLYCCAPPEERAQALARLHRLITVHRTITDPDTVEFAGVIDQAVAMAHPEAAWLPRLAEVVTGRQPPEVLAGWPAWPSNAAPAPRKRRRR